MCYLFIIMSSWMAWYQAIERSGHVDQSKVIGVMEILRNDVSQPTLSAIKEVWSTMKEMPFQITGTERLKDVLKDMDDRSGRLEEAGKLFSQGRDLSLGLRLDEAASMYEQAIQTIKDSYVIYHDSARMAELWLYLGVTWHQANKKDQAKEAFVHALDLAPALELSKGYFSPSVRDFFEEVRTQDTKKFPTLPSSSSLSRVCEAAKLDGIVIVSQATLSDQEILRLVWFDVSENNFTKVETLVVGDGNNALGAQRAARNIGSAILNLPVVSETDSSINGAVLTHKTMSEEPAYEPWYLKHWWIWPVGAAVISAGIILPIALSGEDVVEFRVKL